MSDELKIIPNVENEGVVIGGLVKAEPEVRARVAAKLSPNDFADPTFRAVFEALAKLAKTGAGYHRDTVVQLSEDEVRLETLAEIERDFDELPEQNFDAHIAILRRGVAKRAAAPAFERLREAMTLPSVDTLEVEQAALDVLRDVRGAAGGDVVVSGPDAVSQVADEIAAAGDDHFAPTYYGELDELLNHGFRPGLVVLAARPSVGKSVFVSNLLLRQAIHNKRWLAVPVEPGKRTVLEQMYCVYRRFKGEMFSKFPDQISDEQLEDFRAEMGRHGQNVDFIERRIPLDRLLVEMRAGKYHGVVVDLFEYLLPDVEPATITEALRECRATALETGTCFVVVHQIKRPPHRKGKKDDIIDPETVRPTREDLKHSGGYEEVADLILLLHRNAAIDVDWDENVLEICISKQKVGSRGRVLCYRYEPETWVIEEFVRRMSWS